MDEVWKSIPGYEGIYEASTFGRIRSAAGKTTKDTRHGGLRVWKQRIIKPRAYGGSRKDSRVYLYKDGRGKSYLVARLVASTFLGEPGEEMTVNHKDGDNTNNHVSNLEWLTLGDNIRHGFDTGLFDNIKDPVELRSVTSGRIERFTSKAEASRYLNRNHAYIYQCLKNRRLASDLQGEQYEVRAI